MAFEKMLKAWLLSFDATNKHNLISLHLNGLVSLCQVKISLKFVRVATSFSDLELHIFHFGMRKLYPSFKKFNAIIGFLSIALQFYLAPLGPPVSICRVLSPGKEDVSNILFRDKSTLYPISCICKGTITLLMVYIAIQAPYFVFLAHSHLWVVMQIGGLKCF